MDANLTGQSVRDLQEMLWVLSLEDLRMPRLIPDGRFGEETLEAVMVFQRDHGMPVTGVVDMATWDAVRQAYGEVMGRIGPPMPLRVLEHGKSGFQSGDKREQITLLKTMFAALAGQFAGFESGSGPDGAFREAEAHNTRLVQRASGQPETGVMDRAAWDALARLYQLAVTREGLSRPRAVSPESP